MITRAVVYCLKKTTEKHAESLIELLRVEAGTAVGKKKKKDVKRQDRNCLDRIAMISIKTSQIETVKVPKAKF